METIKPQLEALDEQLRNIDVQISQAIADETKKQEEEKSPENKEPQTSEEIQYEKMTDVVSLSNDVDNVDLLDSVKDRVDGRIKVLKSEIELDKLNNELSGASSYKERELADLETQSVKIASDIGSRMADIVKESNEDNEKIPEKDSEDSDDSHKLYTDDDESADEA